jgi:2-polyprenyl-6-methoxyphenol hydroxylase-like FAD-dependent oxidoreductase
MTQSEEVTTTVCIVGGGPAGMMLGVLLARSGIEVVVLEKYADFFRDFRGDTIHASTLQMMDELGWLEAFLALPHDELRDATFAMFGQTIPLADFTRLPTRCKFLAYTPQWDFLNFLAERGKRYPTFRVMMETSGTARLEQYKYERYQRTGGQQQPARTCTLCVRDADPRPEHRRRHQRKRLEQEKPLQEHC